MTPEADEMTVRAPHRFLDPGAVAASVTTTVMRCRTDCVVVGSSAAAVWGMPLPATVAESVRNGLVSVSRVDSGPASRQNAFDGHSLELPSDHWLQQGLVQITTPARTWLDCAALLPADHLLAMGDWALDQGLLAMSELTSLIAWARRRRGVVRARQVAPWLRRGVESPQESRLRWFLVDAGLPEPAINPEIVLPDQRVVRLDLAYLGLRVGLEFDGDWHVATREHDEGRRAALTAAGWKVLVARKDDLWQPGRLMGAARQALIERSGNGRKRW